MPTAAATACAVAALSPVSMTTSMPAPRRRATARRRRRRAPRSASAMTPSSAPPARDADERLARRAAARATHRRRRSTPSSRRKSSEPSSDASASPSSVPRAPLPGIDAKSRDAAAARCPRRAPRATIAARADASSPARALAADAQHVVARRARRTRRRRVTAGRPSVSVPVLSTISVCSRPACSSAAALRIRMPDCAPRPVPTMIAVGVARPSAHGHAMTSTATAWTSARVASPASHHVSDERQRGDQRRRPARRRRRRGRPGAGSAPSTPAPRATSRTMPASSVASPTPVASHVSMPSWFSVPANTCAPGAFATGRLSPVSMLSSTLDAPSRTTPSTGTLSPGAHDEAVAGDDLRERHVDGRAVALDVRDLAAAAAAGLRAPPTCRPSRAPRAACRAAPA